MSRHQFNNQHYIITIGWDSPLNTFFATIVDEEVENGFDEPLIWLGTQLAEYQNVHQFLHTLRQKLNEKGIIDVTLPDSLTQMLEKDQMDEGEQFKERPIEIKNFILKLKDFGQQ